MNSNKEERTTLSKTTWNEVQLKLALYDELQCILDYWMEHAVDHANGGFVGRVDDQNKVTGVITADDIIAVLRQK